MVIELGLFLALGMVVGLVAPAAGIGGGVLMVPAFLVIFPAFGIAPDMAAHMAVGSSVGAAALMSLSAVHAHARNGAVDWRVFKALAPGLIVGAVIGGVIAHGLPDDILRRVFGALMLLLAIYLVWGRQPHEWRHSAGPSPRTALSAGFVIGEVGSMVGVGGGSMIVPFLLFQGLHSQRVAGTSSAGVLVAALTAAITYILVGRESPGLPAYSLGYLYGPAVTATAITAMLLAPLEAKIAQHLPRKRFQRLFAILLLIIAVRMLVF